MDFLFQACESGFVTLPPTLRGAIPVAHVVNGIQLLHSSIVRKQCKI